MRGSVLLLLATALAVTGCNSTETTLVSAANASRPQTAATATLSRSAPVKVSFAPVVGAPGAAATPLTKRMTARARERGLDIVAAGGGTAQYEIRGYFSALSDTGVTTVIYVWDVLDARGNRLHRIQGQQRSPEPSGPDAWKSVTTATMETIADQSLTQLSSWIASQRAPRTS